MHEDRTERIRTDADRVEVNQERPGRTDGPRHEVVETSTPQRIEVRTRQTPSAEVDRAESLAYDPYASRRLAAFRVTQFIYWIFGLIEGLVAIRLILMALGASPSAGFAQFIYGVTTPLVAPFVGLFSNPKYQGGTLELTSVVALIVYALVAFLLGRLAWILVGEHRSAVRTRSTSFDSRSS